MGKFPKLDTDQGYLFFINGSLVGAGLFHKYNRYGCQMHGDNPKNYLEFNRIKSSGKLGSISSVEITGELTVVSIHGIAAIDVIVNARKVA